VTQYQGEALIENSFGSIDKTMLAQPARCIRKAVASFSESRKAGVNR
jgi:hypothetical protein